MSERYRPNLKEIHDDICVSLAAKGKLRENGIGYLEPRLWEELRLTLQRRYREATGEIHATLLVVLEGEA
jgi:hypothetical protein